MVRIGGLDCLRIGSLVPSTRTCSNPTPNHQSNPPTKGNLIKHIPKQKSSGVWSSLAGVRKPLIRMQGNDAYIAREPGVGPKKKKMKKKTQNNRVTIGVLVGEIDGPGLLGSLIIYQGHLFSSDFKRNSQKRHVWGHGCNKPTARLALPPKECLSLQTASPSTTLTRSFLQIRCRRVAVLVGRDPSNSPLSSFPFQSLLQNRDASERPARSMQNLFFSSPNQYSS